MPQVLKSSSLLCSLLTSRPSSYRVSGGGNNRYKISIAFVFSLLFLIPQQYGSAQASYGAVAAYSLRKIIPAYSGNCIQVRRTCDNATLNIGFSSCGDLDTVTLKTFVLASNPLSAITSSASTAYSLRKLNCTYSGNAIRIRSSATGNPTLDIGFTASGDLDTASMKTFVGANNAFVTIWYDQSGNGRNASQSTNGAQPRIMSAGVIERQGNRPAIRWLGNGYNLATAAFTTYTAAACFNAVARVNTNVTYNTIVNKTTSNFPAPIDFYNNQMVVGNGASYNFFGYGQTFNATLPLSVWTYQAASGGNYNFYYNGGSTASGAVGFYGDNGNPLTLGSRSDGVTGLNGWISESVTFNSIPTAIDRQFLEWSQAQYYSISGPTISAFPAAAASASVTVWYDQSGYGWNAIQPTQANQPRIINAGSIEKNGSYPAIRFNGAPQNLIAALPTTVYPLSVSLLANTSGASTAGAFVKIGTDVNAGAAGFGIGIGNSGGTFDTPGTSVIAIKEWVSWCPSNPNVNYPATPFVSTSIQLSGGGGSSTFLNGTNVPLSNASNAVGASISGSVLIGGYANGTNRYPSVKESEVIIYSTAISSTSRVLLESNQAAYQNISVSGGKYTVPSANSYHRFVNGVGRVSATDSVAGTKATTGMGISIGTTASDFLKDNGDYLTIGMDCPNPVLSTSNLPGTITHRWTNDWYLNKTDVSSNNGNVTLYFDFGDYGVTGTPGTAANYSLLHRSTASGNFTIVAGTTKSVVGDRIRFTLDAANLINNYYYTVGTSNIGTSPLPVQLTSFDLICENKTVKAKWSTAVEINSSHFTLEKSADAEKFVEVVSIPSKATKGGGADYEHSFTVHDEGIRYYRLKELAHNGEIKVYPIKALTCAELNPDFKIFPNPNSGSFKIINASPNSTLIIFNAMGIETGRININSRESEIDLGTDLPAGVYTLQLNYIGGQQIQRLIIVR